MEKIFWHKKVLLTLILFVLFGCEQKTIAQNTQIKGSDKNYQETYIDLFDAEKYVETLAHLQLWENAEPDNPEMFIAYFNYYIARNRFSGISIDREQKGSGPTMEITDPQTGEILGYLNDSVQYNTEDIFTAIEYLDRGLDMYPDRLDMHFGKIHILNETGYYKMAGGELFATLEISKRVNNNWAWADNGKITNGELFFVSSIQDYYRFWLNAETKEAYDQIKLCTEKQIELYPGNIYGYNYLAIYYLMNEQFQAGLEYLLQAEIIAPNDCIVLENIGRTYMNMNNNQKAEEYFRKILEVGNEQDKMYAQYYLDLL